MSFAWPWCFLVLPLPWLLRRLLAPVEAGVALQVPELPVLATAQRMGRSPSLWLAALAWILLVTAAARPQMPDPTGLQPVRGRDLMLAIDVSASMAQSDLQLDGRPAARLRVARSGVDAFLQRRQGDRVGLIVFGSQAYLHTPLTFDLHAVRAGLGSLEVGFAGPETALGDAIGLATKHLKPLAEHSRELVLLTDGANTTGTLTPQRAAWLAQREGVRIHVVGIGGVSAHKPDANRSADGLDEATLQQIAQQTGGSYARGADGAAMEDFFRRLDQIVPTPDSAVVRQPQGEWYAWPLAMAMALAVWLLLRRNREAGTWV